MTNERFDEVQNEISNLQEVDNAISDIVDSQETKKETLGDLKAFDSDLVYDTLNAQATVYENLSKKFYQFEIDNIGNEASAKYWHNAAKDQETTAKDLRQMLTHIVRMQKQNDRMNNLLKQLDK